MDNLNMFYLDDDEVVRWQTGFHTGQAAGDDKGRVKIFGVRYKVSDIKAELLKQGKTWRHV